MTSHFSIGRTLFAVMLAALALFAISAQGASAAVTVSPSTFEGGDGNTLVNTLGNTDWATPATRGPLRRPS
jgi:hypothetical protein